MKFVRICIAMAVAGALVLPATSAQSRVGMIAGLNVSTIKSMPDIEAEQKRGLVIGLTADLMMSDFAAINITGVYSRRGCVVDGMNLNLNYLESDLRLKILLGGEEGAFYLMGGPRVGALMGSSIYDPISGDYVEINEVFDEYDIAISGGLGFRLGPVFFEASYSSSLADLFLEDYAEMLNQGIQICGGISIPIGY